MRMEKSKTSPGKMFKQHQSFIILKPVPQSTSQKQQQPVQTSSLSEEEKVFGPYEQQQQPVQTNVQQQPTSVTLAFNTRWYCYKTRNTFQWTRSQSSTTLPNMQSTSYMDSTIQKMVLLQRQKIRLNSINHLKTFLIFNFTPFHLARDFPVL